MCITVWSLYGIINLVMFYVWSALAGIRTMRYKFLLLAKKNFRLKSGDIFVVYYFNLFQITYYSCALHLTFQDAKYNTLFQVFKLNLKVSKTIGVPKVHCLFFCL